MNEIWREEVRKKTESTWRRNLFRGCVLLDIVIAVFEFCGFWMFYYSGELEYPVPLYLARFFILPTCINVISTFWVSCVMRREHTSEVQKNQAVCILIFIICAVTECTHYVFPATMCLTCIAIFMTVLFRDVTCNRMFYILSLFVMSIAVASNYMEGNTNLFYSAMNFIVATVITSLSFYESRLLTRQEQQYIENIMQSNKFQNDLLSELKIEPLTGLYNRKALMESLEAKYQQYQKRKHPLYLVMLDIDDFKLVNDTYGHTKGDEVLVSLGQILKEAVAGEGSAYRYGGEEFILLFEKQTLEEVCKVTENIRREIKSTRFSFMSGDKSVTLSAGIAGFQEEWEVDEWVDKADVALYRAKKNGKDQYIVFR